MSTSLSFVSTLLLQPLAQANLVPSTTYVQIREITAQKFTSQRTEKTNSLFGCQIEKFTLSGRDPVTEKSQNTYIEIYEPRKNNPTYQVSAVFILPPTGGTNVLDRGYANLLCKRGLRAVIVSHWDRQNDVTLELTMHSHGALRALTATRQTISFLNQYRGVTRPGLLGTSIGAITASLVMAFEPEIRASALLVGSLDFADVVAESTEKGAQKIREKRFQKFNLGPLENYRAQLRAAIAIEPRKMLEISPYRGSTLAVTATHDVTVPTRYQYLLAQTLDPKIHLEVPGNHFDVILKAYGKHRDKIVSYFLSELTN